MSCSWNRSADSANSQSRDFCSRFGSAAPDGSAKIAGHRQGSSRNLAPFRFLVTQFGKHGDFLWNNLLQASSPTTINILLSVT